MPQNHGCQDSHQQSSYCVLLFRVRFVTLPARFRGDRVLRESALAERGTCGASSLRNQAFRPHLVVPAQVMGSPACSVRVSRLPSGV